MLHALLNGKAGTLPADAKPGDSLRKVYRGSEDLLTATVFERLAYLDGPTLWELLRATFRPEILPARRAVDLEEVEFWPTWSKAAGTLGQSVEPDVVLRFSAGDPARKVTIIVEAKLGGFQDPGQWREREWLAHREEFVGADSPDDCFFLAIGGLPDRAERVVLSFLETIAGTTGAIFPAAAADWKDLARTLQAMATGAIGPARVLSDLREALALHGYRHMQGLRELAALSGQRSETFDRSLGHLRRGRAVRVPALAPTPAGAPAAPTGLAGWPTRIAAFRPILTSSATLRTLAPSHAR